jgi:nitrate/nitrite transport system substrate-binding protein
MPDVDVAKQASWGTTRDNMVLGSVGRHRRRAHPDADALSDLVAGLTTQNNKPCRCTSWRASITNGQAISVAKELMPTGATVDAAPLKAAFAKMKASGKDVKAP